MDKLLNHVMNGGESRFNSFCEALVKTGQHNIVNTVLKPTSDAADATPVDATPVRSPVEAPSSGRTISQADVFINRDSQLLLRRNWNKLLCDIRADEELLSRLVELKVFTEFQVKRLQVSCYFACIKHIKLAR